GWGQPADAARLLGAADALLRAIGLPPDDYEQLVPDLGRVRQLLGEGGYAAALAAGRALPGEQAVAEAEALCAGRLRGRGARRVSVPGGSGARVPAEGGDPAVG